MTPAFNQDNLRSLGNATAQKILQETTYYNRSQNHVGMLAADDKSSVPNNFPPAIVQLKIRENRLGRDPNLKEQYSSTSRGNDAKITLLKSRSLFFGIDETYEW